MPQVIRSVEGFRLAGLGTVLAVPVIAVGLHLAQVSTWTILGVVVAGCAVLALLMWGSYGSICRFTARIYLVPPL